MDKKKMLSAINKRFMEAYEDLVEHNEFRNLRSFCTEVGIPYSNWSKFERGERNVDLVNIVGMTESYSVSLEYLLLGEGPKRISLNSSSATNNIGVNHGNNIGQNSGSGQVTQTHSTGNAGQVAVDDCALKLEAANRENELLRNQLADKERIIKLLERHSMPPS